jgi:hypothetical protein
MPKFFNYLRQEGLPPSGFEYSLRFVGTDYQQNYFFANESEDYSISFTSNISRPLRDALSNEIIFTSLFDATPSDKHNYSISFNSLINESPGDIGKFILFFSGSPVSQVNESGDISTNLNFAFREPDGAVDSGRYIALLERPNIESSILETGYYQLHLENFLKNINKVYNVVDIITYTGSYAESALKRDFANLDIIFNTGSYQGA